MPPKASARVPAAPAAEVEDVTTLIPCPVLTAHPNGFVERTEPERETHEVRCAPDSSPRNGPPPVGGRDRPPRPPRARLASPRALPTLPRASAPDLHTLSPVRALLSPAPSPRSAYKLGKKKRSYNQVELTFDRAAPGKCVNDAEASIDDTALNIYEATERSFSVDVPVELRDSALEYELKLYNGSTVRALIYLVYAEPLSSVPGAGPERSPSPPTARTISSAPGTRGSPSLAPDAPRDVPVPSSPPSSASASRDARRRAPPGRRRRSPTRAKSGRMRETSSSPSTRPPTTCAPSVPTSARFSGTCGERGRARRNRENIAAIRARKTRPAATASRAPAGFRSNGQ